MKVYRIYIICFIIISVVVKLKSQPYDFVADVTEGCDTLYVNFSFISTASVDTISYIIWDLGNGEVDTTLNETDILAATYDVPSRYPVVVYLNDFYNGEAIVKNNYISVYRTVTADFTFRDTVEMSHMSVIFEHVDQPLNNTLTYSFNWDFGDGNTAVGRRVIHTFDSSGTYNVTLNVSDNVGCSDTQSQVLNLIVQDAIADVTQGCDSLKVKFSLTNVDTDTVTSIVWNFGNGTFSNLIDPDTVLYINTTRVQEDFNVRITINGDTNSIFKPDYITVYRTLRASFECVDTLTTEDRIIQVCYNLDRLFDTSATYTYEWRFEGIGTLNDSRPLVTYPADPDTISIRLTINDVTHGCTDSRIRRIILIPEILVQNVFTPNGDNINDFFMINSVIPLKIQIFSRSGLLVFQTEGTQIIWYGDTATGIELESGIYYYVLKAVSDDPGGKYNKAGFIYLYR